MRGLVCWLPRRVLGLWLDVVFGPEEPWEGYVSTTAPEPLP